MLREGQLVVGIVKRAPVRDPIRRRPAAAAPARPARRRFAIFRVGSIVSKASSSSWPTANPTTAGCGALAGETGALNAEARASKERDELDPVGSGLSSRGDPQLVAGEIFRLRDRRPGDVLPHAVWAGSVPPAWRTAEKMYPPWTPCLCAAP
jgi:hypothetical protein